MNFDLKSTFAKFYLGLGTSLCMLYLVGALAGWKMPEFKSSGYSGSGYHRSYGGSWGYSK